MKFIPLVIFSSFLSLNVLAETLSLDYGSFYSHVKKIDDDDTGALQFAFGFKRVQQQHMCAIVKAFIHTQKKDIPLTITPEQRFTVPSEKALKLAKATVVIELNEKANLCDMSVQLETKPEYLKREYSATELNTLLTQYQAFFDNMGGIMSFLMPGTDGLKLHFDQVVNHQLPSGHLIENSRLVVSEHAIVDGVSFSLPAKPVRITAKMDNEN